MKARSLATRVALLGSVLIGFGAFAASPALAIGSPTVTTLESSQDPSPACGTVTLTATVFGAIWPDSPLGFVQFFDGGLDHWRPAAHHLGLRHVPRRACCAD